MNNQGQRLKAARKAAGFKTAAAAAERHGWNLSTFRGHEAASRGISKRALFSYARAFGVSPSWLLTGVEDHTGERLRHDEHATSEKVMDGAIGVRRVPIVGLGEMDAMERNDQEELISKNLGWVSVADTGLSQNVIASKVPDNSMEPTLLKGDLVISDSETPVSPGCVVVAGVEGEASAVIRRYGEINTTDEVILTTEGGALGSWKHPRNKMRFLRRGVALQRSLL